MAWKTPHVKRPDIYGDEAKCRTALARCIKNGEDLLAQADGVKKRMDAVPGDDVDADMTRSLLTASGETASESGSRLLRTACDRTYRTSSRTSCRRSFAVCL